MVGTAALITVLWSITVFMFSKLSTRLSKDRTKEIIDATTRSMQLWIKRQMQQLTDGRDPKLYFTLAIHFNNNMRLAIPMIPRIPILVSENVWMAVVSHTSHATILSLTCQGFGNLPVHMHPHTCETIEVKEGTMTCLLTGKVYRAGDFWKIEAGEAHGAHFWDFVGFVTHRPPLPTADVCPVSLDDMESIFPPSTHSM
jgi:hypothetical protein